MFRSIVFATMLAAAGTARAAYIYSIAAAGPIEACDTLRDVCIPGPPTISGTVSLGAALSVSFQGFGGGWDFQNLSPSQISVSGGSAHVAVSAPRTDATTGSPVDGRLTLRRDDTFTLDNQHGETLLGQIALAANSANTFGISAAALPWLSCGLPNEPCARVPGNASGSLTTDLSIRLNIGNNRYSFDHMWPLTLDATTRNLQLISLLGTATDGLTTLQITDNRFVLDNGHGEGFRGNLAFVPEPSMLLLLGLAAMVGGVTRNTRTRRRVR